MKRIMLIFSSIALLPSLLLLAQQPLASLEGIVIETGTSMPLPKASLELRSMDSDRRYPIVSGDRGQFVFRGVTAGRYALIASHNGYMHTEFGQRGPNGFGLDIVLAAGEKRIGVRLVMTRSGAISGHAIGTSGTPVAYTQVQALRLSYPSGQRTLTLVSSTVTDDLGAYRLYGLPPGQYVISAQTNPPSLGIMPVLASSTPPMPGTVMFASAAGPMQYDADPANQSRRLNTSSLSYFPNVTDDRDARSIELRPGDDVAGIDVTINAVSNKPVTITGTVVGNVAANAQISVVIAQASGGIQARLAVQPGATFNITLTSLPPGSYIAAATDRPGPPFMSAGYVSFEIRAGVAPPNLALSLVPLPPVSGRITVEGGNGSIDITGVRLDFRREPSLSSFPTTSSVMPKSDGSFTTPGLFDGDWVVQPGSAGDMPINTAAAGFRQTASYVDARREPAIPAVAENLRNAYVKSMRVSNAEIVNSRLRIPKQSSDPIELQVVLGLNGGQISGVARNKDGESQPNVRIVLIPDQQERSELYRTISTDGEGRFRLDAIPPGDYRLFCWEDVQLDDWRNPAFLTPLLDRGKPVHIDEGSRVNLDALMISL
jgi:hypothetical protein